MAARTPGYMNRHDAHRQVPPAYCRPPGGGHPPRDPRLSGPVLDGLGEVAVRVGIARQPPRDSGQRGGQVVLIQRVQLAPREVPELADHQAPTRPGNPQHLGQRRVRVGDVPQAERDRHDVEHLVREGQPEGVAGHEPDWPVVGDRGAAPVWRARPATSLRPATGACQIRRSLRAPTWSMPSEKSQATQTAPAEVKVTDELPVPAARSSTRSPARAPTTRATTRRHHRSWPSERTSFSRS